MRNCSYRYKPACRQSRFGGLASDEGGTTERMMTDREEGTNRRLKYAQDPNNNNEVTILEADHYYPFCLRRLRHEGEEDIKPPLARASRSCSLRNKLKNLLRTP